MSMRIPSMFKTPKHRSFDYKPLIYDESKERARELEKLAEDQRNGKLSDEVREARLRKIFGAKRSAMRGNRKQQSFNQTARFLVILAVLFGLVWFFFN